MQKKLGIVVVAAIQTLPASLGKRPGVSKASRRRIVATPAVAAAA